VGHHRAHPVIAVYFACLVFSFFYYWLVNFGEWPPADTPLPALRWPTGAAALYVLASLMAATQLIRRNGRGGGMAFRLALMLALAFLVGGWIADAQGIRQSGLSFSKHAFGAMAYAISGTTGVLVFTLMLMVLFALARSFAGRLDRVRRAVFDNIQLLWHYAVVQGLVGLAVTHLPSRLTE
jgi:cytochrome c oxidase subunit I+III